MLRYFYYQFAFSIFERNFDSIIDLWQITFCELNVQHGTDNLGNFTNIICHRLFLLILLFLVLLDKHIPRAAAHGLLI